MSTAFIQKNRGFSLGELLVIIGILALATSIVIAGYLSFRKSQVVSLDAQKIVSALNQARNQTLLSKNSSAYGVHFTSNTVTVFTGTSFVNGGAGNEDIQLSTSDISITPTLAGGGSDVIFDRLTGETSQSGTVVITSPGNSQTKTVTIYKTGVIEVQ